MEPRRSSTAASTGGALPSRTGTEPAATRDVLLSGTANHSAVLPAVSELEEHGVTIVSQLDKAEEEMDESVGNSQPFSTINDTVMHDISHLRNRQFDMFRRHVEIEHTYKVHQTRQPSHTFTGIATTMRKKEIATAGLLNRLADFDAQLRSVMDKFEPQSTSNSNSNSNHSESSDNVNETENENNTTTENNTTQDNEDDEHGDLVSPTTKRRSK